MREPLPGDYGLTEIKGFTGWWVGLGQFLNGDPSPYTHAFVVLDDDTVLEAMPGGAIISPISKYFNDAIYSSFPLTTEQRATIVSTARKLEGTPYSFLDYIAIALKRFKINLPWVTKRVVSSGHMICSQVVDYCYSQADVHLFNDGRPSHMVTPGDLAELLLVR